MDISEYKNIFQHENSHFFYVGTHKVILEILQKYLVKKNNINILDAGCGTGLLLKKLKLFGEVHGVDISAEALKFSKKRGIKKIYHSSITKLPFTDKKFDVVLSIDVLYHQKVTSDIKALKEFYRVLKPGGLLIIKVPAYEWLRGHHDIIVQTRHRYEKSELTSKLQSCGFDIQKISYFFTFILPFVLLKRLIDKLISKKVSSEIQDIPSFLNKTLIWLTIFEMKIFLYINLPYGISILAVAKKQL